MYINQSHLLKAEVLGPGTPGRTYTSVVESGYVLHDCCTKAPFYNSYEPAKTSTMVVRLAGVDWVYKQEAGKTVWKCAGWDMLSQSKRSWKVAWQKWFVDHERPPSFVIHLDSLYTIRFNADLPRASTSTRSKQTMWYLHPDGLTTVFGRWDIPGEDGRIYFNPSASAMFAGHDLLASTWYQGKRGRAPVPPPREEVHTLCVPRSVIEQFARGNHHNQLFTLLRLKVMGRDTRGNVPGTLREIADTLGITTTTLRSHLRFLEQEDWLLDPEGGAPVRTATIYRGDDTRAEVEKLSPMRYPRPAAFRHDVDTKRGVWNSQASVDVADIKLLQVAGAVMSALPDSLQHDVAEMDMIYRKHRLQGKDIKEAAREMSQVDKFNKTVAACAYQLGVVAQGDRPLLELSAVRYATCGSFSSVCRRRNKSAQTVYSDSSLLAVIRRAVGATGVNTYESVVKRRRWSTCDEPVDNASNKGATDAHLIPLWDRWHEAAGRFGKNPVNGISVRISRAGQTTRRVKKRTDGCVYTAVRRDDQLPLSC